MNLRKRDGGPGARKPGDMVPVSGGGRSDDVMLNASPRRLVLLCKAKPGGPSLLLLP